MSRPSPSGPKWKPVGPPETPTALALVRGTRGIVNHRHLLPNEIDLLVDGEAGFGVAPLRAHVAECDECRAQARRRP